MHEDFQNVITILFERSPDGWLLVDRGGTIQVANVAARAVLAVDGSELEGSPLASWLPDLAVEEPANDTETTMLSGQGDRFPVEISVVPLPNAEGRRWVIFRDITLRKGFEGSVRQHAEELERTVRIRARELEDLRERHRRLYDLVPVLDVELDSQNNIASANRKACVSLGVANDRLVGLPLAGLAVPDRKQDLADALVRMRDGAQSPFETRLRTVDGSVIDIVLHAALEGNGPRAALRVVGLDVTARREAEQLVDQSLELAEAQRARMERILRGIGEGVVVTDPDGQVRLMNPIAERFLGIDEQFAFGRNLFGEQRDTGFTGIWREFVDGGEDLIVTELTIGPKKNRVFTVTMSRIRTPEGRPAGCVSVLRDVTQERRVERMKRDFVSNITHELRTPLASIRAFTATMLRGGPVGEEDSVRFLGIVEKEAERLQHLIEGLLTLSSVESGREALDLQPGDFATVVHEAHEMFIPVAREKDVQLCIQIEGNNGAGIFDPQKMRRVLDNLMGNAIKFTPAGGRVTVDFSRNAETIACTVSDTGPGIPADQLERIFDRFYTSASASTGNPSGSGLGLHIVQRLVELHDGEIAVESRVGVGTTFRFHFPAVPRVRDASGIHKAPAEEDLKALPIAHDISPTGAPTAEDPREFEADLPPLPPGDPLLDDPDGPDDAPDTGDMGDASRAGEEIPELRVLRPPVPHTRSRDSSTTRD